MKKHKFIILTLIISILCIGLIFIISKNNKSIAVSYGIGDVVYINGTGINPDPDQGIYCIVYGPQFVPGYFICYDGPNNLPSDVAYVLGHVDPSDYSYYDGTFRTDIRQNYLWEYLGKGSHVADYGMANDITNLKNEANIIQNLTQSSVSIDPLEEEFIKPNDKGEFGPFVINYPSVNGKWVGDNLKITINDKELTTIPESGKEFYLTEEDGIKFGEKNILKISYTATQYDAYMYEFGPEQDITISCTGCPDCGNSFYYNGIGYQTPENEVILDETIRCPECGYRFSKSEANYYINSGDITIGINGSIKQCVAYIEVESSPIELEDEVEFWVGRKIVINLNKTDNGTPAQVLENIEFDVEILNSTIDKTYILGDDYSQLSQTTIETDSDGNAQIVIITYEENVRVQISEKYNKYYIDDGPIIIDFILRGDSWTSQIVQPTGTLGNLVSIKQEGEEFEFSLQIKNRAKIENLKLLKFNVSMGEEPIAGVEFRVLLGNAKTEDNKTSVVVTTDRNGEIDLGTLEVIDPNKDVTITIEEIGVPNPNLNFHGLYPNGRAVITIRHRQEGCKVDVIGADSKYVSGEYNVDENIVEIRIENEVTMDISGKVWQDGQTGLKPVVGPNGIYDSSEKGIPDIEVTVTEGKTQIKTTYTDSNGKYEFKDLPQSINNPVEYYIEFTYDGINYIATTPNVGTDESKDSDAQELDRTSFNNKFHTIEKDVAIGTDGSRTTLKYICSGNTATLETVDGSGKLKTEFEMIATTLPTTYNENTKNVDLGLVKKGVDLAAVTDIYSAKVTINGKEMNYTYNDIISLNDNITIADPKPSYNLYLYNSDYNYRINDYSSLPVLTGTAHPTLETGEYGSMLNKKKEDGELNVELTYQVLLNNQSATDATINSIAYYYDTGYVLDGASPEIVTIDGKTYNKVIIPINKTFTDSNNQEIYNLTLTVGKDSSGALITGEMKTWVEIVSYSTNESCIDTDSAPDNILEHKTEDDTDDARGLTIQINSVNRTISGYVFEDKKANMPGQYNTGDGEYQDSEQKVSDVIVQLIEIKNVTVGATTLKLEYIWQETVSGSNTVKYITNDGRNIATYNVTNDPGHYTFTDFIPGNYIVRFIYGDETYYDTAIDGSTTSSTAKQNITTYNGQDYKSTIDSNYNKEWFNASSYSENSSMARDNEERRIEEMAHATTTDPSNLIINSKDKLEDTWMCAESSKLEIPVSQSATDQTVPVERAINFGLVKRPQPALTLEKHVTALQIGDIIDTTADIYNYTSDGKNVNITSNTGSESVNLATATNKGINERGKWQVVTDPNNLSDKKINITYTYIVTNVGDKDYIGEGLASVATSEYANIAQTVKQDMRSLSFTPGHYVGTAYYTGNIGSDREVATPVKIEDYLGKTKNTLKLGTGDFTEQGSETKNIWADSGNEATEEVNVIQTANRELNAGNQITFTANVYKESLDISGGQDFTFMSYAAQLIPADGNATSKTGTLANNITLGNLEKIQSYAPLGVIALTPQSNPAIPVFTPEVDESVAETIIITMDFGGDKETPILLITAITGGLVVIAIGIVLIKKFVIK